MSSDFKSSSKKAPLDQRSNAQIPLMVHCSGIQFDNEKRFTRAQKIHVLAVKKWKTNGRGITIRDLIFSGLARNKGQAQDAFKRCLAKKVVFVDGNHKPQTYFPSSLKAEIFKARISKNAPVGVTEVPYLQSSNFSGTDAIIMQTLEGYVLPLLPKLPASIHKIQLELTLNPEYYNEIRLLSCSENLGKKYEDIIDSILVRYLFYPNGKVMVFVACSNKPFKLESSNDLDRLIAFLGAVRDRLIVYLCDKHERAVPDIMQWHLTECDINRDVKVSHWLQYTGLNIQVRHALHLFRIYIKVKGENTLCRIEESVSFKNKPVLEAINEIFNPNERLEKQIAELNSKFSKLLESFGSTCCKSHSCTNLGSPDIEEERS